MRSNQKPAKAYNNLEFLNSPEARTIRILAEFLEPMRRFKREDIHNTIVVFGSARVYPRSIARKNLATLTRQVASAPHPSARFKAMLRKAQTDVEMSDYYEAAAQLTYELTKWSQTLSKDKSFVICSGGGPGIMEAANRGAIRAGGKSIGLNISLPTEQECNRFITRDLNFDFHYFFMRKFWFVYLAKALVLFPGGFGTFDELFEVLTLLQTRKVKKTLPVVLYGERYWKEILNFDALLRHNTISKKDLRLFRFANSTDEALDILKTELQKIHKANKRKSLLQAL